MVEFFLGIAPDRRAYFILFIIPFSTKGTPIGFGPGPVSNGRCNLAAEAMAVDVIGPDTGPGLSSLSVSDAVTNSRLAVSGPGATARCSEIPSEAHSGLFDGYYRVLFFRLEVRY